MNPFLFSLGATDVLEQLGYRWNLRVIGWLLQNGESLCENLIERKFSMGHCPSHAAEFAIRTYREHGFDVDLVRDFGHSVRYFTYGSKTGYSLCHYVFYHREANRVSVLFTHPHTFGVTTYLPDSDKPDGSIVLVSREREGLKLREARWYAAGAFFASFLKLNRFLPSAFYDPARDGNHIKLYNKFEDFRALLSQVNP